jgi:hypothetical protein
MALGDIFMRFCIWKDAGRKQFVVVTVSKCYKLCDNNVEHIWLERLVLLPPIRSLVDVANNG